MGAKLEAFYNEVEKIGGFKAKMRLAVITKVSSVKASSEPDSDEMVKKFQAAIEQIKQEF